MSTINARPATVATFLLSCYQNIISLGQSLYKHCISAFLIIVKLLHLVSPPYYIYYFSLSLTMAEPFVQFPLPPHSEFCAAGSECAYCFTILQRHNQPFLAKLDNRFLVDRFKFHESTRIHTVDLSASTCKIMKRNAAILREQIACQYTTNDDRRDSASDSMPTCEFCGRKVFHAEDERVILLKQDWLPLNLQVECGICDRGSFALSRC
ncbi:hypothetical protein EJ05DRAFT_325628 [Pseudovirgaria hyperparasitica]|uniref:Uncharacterized protein n=1 Tax=Pseudovirgaria hyperparasitica TaxID=470096 RepID=A0A6A6WCR2_9PEZI|nr:uncharacterized protein EJ05DRAFT_325628 [Pseudovirgaria hyperparasitica]KAF2758891.1 hypothetical protein EJ05DRAFT_325628 [Pseudovirgaria hyperparasitica]